ncbi:MAG TPA: STAS domain-containing protein [Candidatus Goldiibacteriota bacterium]|nr:STAS domain-containing protein [Candidatus Goldiibacteriota bacterium]HPI03953.1 STAS domain-containing protein [Candidatus Goldiibacteriota bacterium]HPN65255.1 STAS domain-containing protein [Candidatus Goldiibacteriota bacterium]HRQ43643.1 STAS domain-containing protein [Candidatus Goldiibacteriota bacterium]
MEGLNIKVTDKGDIKVVSCQGYIDTTTSSLLENKMAELIQGKKYKIIMDLGEVDYISSAGWGIFISEIKNIRKNKGDLKLVNMKQEVMEIFELLDFTNILEYYKSTDEAVKKFK